MLLRFTQGRGSGLAFSERHSPIFATVYTDDPEIRHQIEKIKDRRRRNRDEVEISVWIQWPSLNPEASELAPFENA